MPPPAVLGRVAIAGRDQLITRGKDSRVAGVEIREGQVALEADSRLDGPIRGLPAVGWSEDFQQVSGILNLPPGWRLFHASGIDAVSSTWVTDWTLLDLFLVLIVAMAARCTGPTPLMAARPATSDANDRATRRHGGRAPALGASPS